MMDKDIKKWIKEICRGDKVDSFVKVVEDHERVEANPQVGVAVSKDGIFKCNIYTHDHEYRITVFDRGPHGRSYLGCTASTRKPRAGEDWTRGNDLPDGPYNYETWQKIKNGILAYELVKVAKTKKAEPDQVEVGPSIEKPLTGKQR